jgi:hypothetical protein
MTVTTIPLANIAAISAYLSRAGDYPSARNGFGTFFGQGACEIGQIPPGSFWFVSQAFMAFDTSAIPDTDDISSIVLEMYMDPSAVGSGWDVEIREVPWGPDAATTDWVPGGSLDSYPLVASWPASSGVSGVMTFTSESAFLTVAGLKTGTIYLHGSSSQTRTGTQGASERYARFTADATNHPKLIITHAPAAAPIEEVASSLVIDLTLSGELDDVAPVESITTSLGVGVTASAELTDVGLVEDTTTSLPLSIGLDGELTSVPEEVDEMATSLSVTVDLSGTLVSPPLGVPRVRGGLDLTLALSGTLASVTETTQAVTGGVSVVLHLGGTLGHPPVFSPPGRTGRSANRPYVRRSVSLPYRNQSQSRRF